MLQKSEYSKKTNPVNTKVLESQFTMTVNHTTSESLVWTACFPSMD